MDEPRFGTPVGYADGRAVIPPVLCRIPAGSAGKERGNAGVRVVCDRIGRAGFQGGRSDDLACVQSTASLESLPPGMPHLRSPVVLVSNQVKTAP